MINNYTASGENLNKQAINEEQFANNNLSFSNNVSFIENKSIQDQNISI